MEHVDTDDIESAMGPATVKKRVSRALGATDHVLNEYELEPGDALGFGYHNHADQEEVFYVLDGQVTFDTEAGETTVGAGEAIRFGPGEWQLGTNEGDGRARVLAVGAPEEMGETTMVRDCADCGAETVQRIEMVGDKEALATVCVDCGAETGRFVNGEIEA
jgi:uncharacterized cupin superfamily protein